MFSRIEIRRLATNFNVILRNISENKIKYAVSCRYSSSGYILKSPYTDVSLPNIPLHRYVWENIHKWPNHTAIECGVSGRKYSYNELFLKCKRFRTSLRKFGLKKEETIGIVLPNTPEFPIAYLGTLECGLTPTTVNPNYTKEEIVYQLEDCNAKWVVCHPTNLKVLLEVKKFFKNNLNIICTHDLNGRSPGSNNNVILFEDTVNDLVDITEGPEEDIDIASTAAIPYSSGTTGLPKGVCLSHYSIVSNLAQISHPEVDKLIQTTGGHQDVITGVLPFFHIYGNVFVLLQSLRKGAKVISLPQFDPKLYLNILENNTNIFQSVVPPIVFFLGNHEGVKEKHLRGTRELMTGAAPCSPHDIAKIRDKTSTNILFTQAYGMTEASPAITLHTPDGTNEGNTSTIGNMISNTWGKVVNTDTGEELPPNTSGELCFKGPQLMKCYLNNLKATSETIDSNGWLHTGDIGYYDHDGYFYVTDRQKELIKVKGYQVAPAELEEVVRKYPGVLEAGVVGVPCHGTGETPVAFVQTVPGAKLSEEDIKAFVASQLSKYKHLSTVRFVQTIPKTPSGKILRRNLKKLVVNE